MILYLIQMTAGLLMILFAFRPTLRGNGSVLSSVRDLPGSGRKQEEMTLCYKIVIAFLFILFLFLISYRVDRIPTAYNVDEAATAYDALSIVRYGTDRYLYKNPVYFINFGGGQNALYNYLAVLMIRLFGYSILIIRMPAIILSLISAVVFTFLIRREYGNKASLIAMCLFCVLPFSIMHSRWALESYLLFPMLIISGSVLYEAVRTGKLRLFILSGILLGITLYSYAVSYVFLSLFLAPYLVYLFCIKRIGWKHIFAMGIPLFLFALPLILMLAVNNDLMDEIRTPFFSIPKLLQYRGGEIRFRNIIENLKLSKSNIIYCIFFHDKHPYNSIAKFGTLYYFSLPLILLGFVSCLKNALKAFREKTAPIDLMMVLMFFAAFGTTLMLQDINVNRACEIYVPLIWFLASGILTVCSLRRSAAAVTGCAYIILSILFFSYYFNDFPVTMDNHFGFASITDLEDALAFEESINVDRNAVYVIGKNQPYIAVILALDVDPVRFNEGKITEGITVAGFENFRFMRRMHWDGIPEEPIYIFRDINDIPWRMDLAGLESKQFGTVKVYYSPHYYDLSHFE